ncbi:phage neck terminator protein [Paenibacillus agricola]|nr:hypothetical protein [Paenibacillus agricola]
MGKQVEPMIDLELIRSTLVDGLSAHLEIPVMEIHTETATPYPFITYSFRGPIVFPSNTPVVTFIPAEGDEAGEEMTERHTEQPTFRIRFSSCSDQQMESIEYALRMHDWFRTIGRDRLKQEANVVVVQAGKIKGRDRQMDSAWERRHRFYVTFRTVSVVDMNQTAIQTVNWN